MELKELRIFFAKKIWQLSRRVPRGQDGRVALVFSLGELICQAHERVIQKGVQSLNSLRRPLQKCLYFLHSHRMFSWNQVLLGGGLGVEFSGLWWRPTRMGYGFLHLFQWRCCHSQCLERVWRVAKHLSFLYTPAKSRNALPPCRLSTTHLLYPRRNIFVQFSKNQCILNKTGLQRITQRFFFTGKQAIWFCAIMNNQSALQDRQDSRLTGL